MSLNAFRQSRNTFFDTLNLGSSNPSSSPGQSLCISVLEQDSLLPQDCHNLFKDAIYIVNDNYLFVFTTFIRPKHNGIRTLVMERFLQQNNKMFLFIRCPWHVVSPNHVTKSWSYAHTNTTFLMSHKRTPPPKVNTFRSQNGPLMERFAHRVTEDTLCLAQISCDSVNLTDTLQP